MLRKSGVICLLFLSLVFLFLQCESAEADSNFWIVRDSEAKAMIYVSPEASTQAREAAIEFQVFAERISGAKLPIITSISKATENVIFVGYSEEALKLVPELPKGPGNAWDNEGYVIKCRGNRLLLAGNETFPYQGTFYAVYDALERLGCRWYFPSEFGEVVPKKKDLCFPQVNIVEKPDFRVRIINWSGFVSVSDQQIKEQRIWSRRNKLCNRYFFYNCVLPEAQYLQCPTDGSTNRLLPKEKYFEKHPEYYALKEDGTRNPEVPCMTNTGATNAAANTIYDYFKDNPQACSYAFAPPDGRIYCKCDKCQKQSHGGFGEDGVGEGYGKVSDVYYYFVDKVTSLVGEKYPDKWIGTMPYADRFRPPQGISDSWPNVFVLLADAGNCPLHGYNHKICPYSMQTTAMAETWAKQAGAILFYEYDPFGWSKLNRPFWSSERISQSLRWLKAHEGWGFCTESLMAVIPLGLNDYIKSKLSWDIDTSVQLLKSEFYRNFFGPAAIPMGRYYDMIEKHLWKNTRHMEGGFNNLETAMSLWSGQVLDKAAEHISEAKLLSKDLEPYQSRVTAFEAGFNRINYAYEAYQAAANGDYENAYKLAGKMIETIEKLNNPTLLTDKGGNKLGGHLTGEELKAFYGKYAGLIRPPKGQLVAVCPRNTRFQIDPTPKGVVFEWFAADIVFDESNNWRSIQLDKSWVSQGVTGQAGETYKGIGWYQIPVEIPKLKTCGELRLACPGMAAKAVWLWINGELVGYQTYSSGFDFDVSGYLKSGENLIAMRVDGNGGLWDPPYRGFGGIWLPPFIYSVNNI